MKIIDVNENNVSKVGFFCIKNPKHEGYRQKLNWLKKRFTEGLKLKILSIDNKAVGFIEYIPGENAWRAVEAEGYLFIHCIWIMGRQNQRKGFASLLLKECLDDAKKQKKHGVAVVTSESSWLAGKEVFLKNGFESVDKAPPFFELLVKKINKDAPPPKFKGGWEKRLRRHQGLNLVYANQCPYLAESVKELSREAQEKYGIKAKIIELKNCQQAQEAPSAYGVFSLIYDGKLLADHYVSKKRFQNILDKEMK